MWERMHIWNSFRFQRRGQWSLMWFSVKVQGVRVCYPVSNFHLAENSICFESACSTLPRANSALSVESERRNLRQFCHKTSFISKLANNKILSNCTWYNQITGKFTVDARTLVNIWLNISKNVIDLWAWLGSRSVTQTVEQQIDVKKKSRNVSKTK